MESEKRTIGFILVLIIWVLTAILRVYFGILGLLGAQFLDVPISPIINHIILLMFLFIGVIMLFTTYGLWQRKRWGFYAAIGVCIIIFGFDIWGMTIQFTAALGFIVPIIVLIYLYITQSQFGT